MSRNDGLLKYLTPDTRRQMRKRRWQQLQSHRSRSLLVLSQCLVKTQTDCLSLCTWRPGAPSLSQSLIHRTEQNTGLPNTQVQRTDQQSHCVMCATASFKLNRIPQRAKLIGRQWRQPGWPRALCHRGVQAMCSQSLEKSLIVVAS